LLCHFAGCPELEPAADSGADGAAPCLPAQDGATAQGPPPHQPSLARLTGSLHSPLLPAPSAFACPLLAPCMFPFASSFSGSPPCPLPLLALCWLPAWFPLLPPFLPHLPALCLCLISVGSWHVSLCFPLFWLNPLCFPSVHAFLHLAFSSLPSAFCLCLPSAGSLHAFLHYLLFWLARCPLPLLALCWLTAYPFPFPLIPLTPCLLLARGLPLSCLLFTPVLPTVCSLPAFAYSLHGLIASVCLVGVLFACICLPSAQSFACLCPSSGCA
jgi:hypothetical protein